MPRRSSLAETPGEPAGAIADSGPGAALSTLRRTARHRLLWLLLLVALLAAVMVASVMIGSRQVGLADVWSAVQGQVEGFDQAAVHKRIPRTYLAVLAGAALGVSGAVMQGVTRNPLADPGILGVNTGATLAIVIGIAYFGMTSPSAYIWTAIVGAAVTAVAVYIIGSLGSGGATPLKLALAGAATAAALSSFVTAVILPRGDIAEGVRSWQIGGVGGATFASIGHVVFFLAAGFVICMLSARSLDSMALGDELAAGLGEHVVTMRIIASAGAVILCGAATAVTGPIAFVGLVVPHACRLLIGVSHRWLLPFSAVAGALLLTASDVVGRIIARPEEVAVGIITAIIGAPVFIAIVRRQKVRAL